MLEVNRVAEIFEERLKDHKYLVNDEITLADLNVAAQFGFTLQNIVGKEFRGNIHILNHGLKELFNHQFLRIFIRIIPLQKRIVKQNDDDMYIITLSFCYCINYF